MATKNIYAVKGIALNRNAHGSFQKRSFDGPWKPTIEEALTSYVGSKALRSGDFLSTVFIAERTTEDKSQQDSRGVFYTQVPMGIPELHQKLIALGLGPTQVRE
jgi:hypothetical protein